MLNHSPRPANTTSTAGSVAGSTAPPTIVLVHGAWADSSSWGPVIERLLGAGFSVRAIANPLQGIDHDTAYLASYLQIVEGPLVLVGHSYGGAIITNIDTSLFDVRALVYVAGFIPVAGETVGQLAAQSSTPLPLVTVQTSTGPEVLIDPDGFHDAFAGDLDEQTSRVLATVQRPANVRAVAEPTTREAFRAVPTQVLITTRDRAIDPEVQHMMAARTDADVTEIPASHVVMLSQADTVADLISRAASLYPVTR